jgi:hypothetical protein
MFLKSLSNKKIEVFAFFIETLPYSKNPSSSDACCSFQKVAYDPETFLEAA